MSELTMHDAQAFRFAEHMSDAVNVEGLRFAYDQAYASGEPDANIELASKAATAKVAAAFAEIVSGMGLDLTSGDERTYALLQGIDAIAQADPEAFGPEGPDVTGRGSTVFYAAMSRLLSAADVRQAGGPLTLIEQQGIIAADLSVSAIAAALRLTEGQQYIITDDGTRFIHRVVDDTSSRYWGCSISIEADHVENLPDSSWEDPDVTVTVTTGGIYSASVTGIARNKHLTSDLWLPVYAQGYVPPVLTAQTVEFGRVGQGPQVDTADGFVSGLLTATILE